VTGADDVLTAAVTAGTPYDAARQLRRLAPGLDLRAARDASLTEGRAVLVATDETGAALAVRWFAPGTPTTIHDHGSWGAALVLEGRDRYERFETSSGAAVLDATLWLEPGDIVWWDAPPGDVHRQQGEGDGALELVLLASAPPSNGTTFTEVDGVGPARSLVDALRDAYLERSSASLLRHYDDHVIADVCVPTWRFQIKGRDNLAQLLDREELGLDDQRLLSLRAVPTFDGCVIEVSVRFRQGTETRLWRDLHVLRWRDAKVVEHLVYCTGHWDAATIARHGVEAHLIRP
jgi:predicted metal-dependent enzyme (double-stranded beta helix superfamily)